MSMSIIRSMFNFRGIKIVNFDIQDSGSVTKVEIVPDHRFHPICSKCLNKARQVHSTETRLI